MFFSQFTTQSWETYAVDTFAVIHHGRIIGCSVVVASHRYLPRCSFAGRKRLYRYRLYSFLERFIPPVLMYLLPRSVPVQVVGDSFDT